MRDERDGERGFPDGVNRVAAKKSAGFLTLVQKQTNRSKL
jgi:hypothetical protein